MDKLDRILYGVGMSIILTAASYLNTRRTNRKLISSAKTVENTARQVASAVKSCTVPVQRGGRVVTALAMTTPALADQYKLSK